MGKILCECCGKKATGEVLRVQDKYFHTKCFTCKICKKSLAAVTFFSKNNEYFCYDDYQARFGIKCANCNQYVEGEMVTALGNTYHQKCFTCARCRQPFPSGENVTFTGKECLCQKCLHVPVVDSESPQHSPSSVLPECAGCEKELREGQALVALDKQWHMSCFRCQTCKTLLHGEYMGKDGKPYCERDYQQQFGVRCNYCDRFISGKVLQAGDNHHFHPTCARCSKCGDPFGDGEEMYLQGAAIWHPRCGPSPNGLANGVILNGTLTNGHSSFVSADLKDNMHHDNLLMDGLSSTASDTQSSQFPSHARTLSFNDSINSASTNNSFRKYSSLRTGSPGLMLREYRSEMSPLQDVTRIYTCSYLTAEPSSGYLRKPIHPYDKPPKSPQFHRPPDSRMQKYTPLRMSKPGMQALMETIVTESPRPRSPHMNNEEPIELAHFPGAHRPDPKEKPKIERDDFPAPPFPYTDPERKRRWSGSHKSDNEDEITPEELVDGEIEVYSEEDPRLKKEEEELSKIATGIGKVFLHQIKEREKLRQWRLQHLDPRNSSRTPSADKEPNYKLRYESPINASPSRTLDHPRPWEEEEFERSSSYRSSVGRSVGTIPSYHVISSLRTAPRPGYGLKSSTLPATGRNGGTAGMPGEFLMGLGEKTQSGDLSSTRSDISASTLSETEKHPLQNDLRPSSTFSSSLRYVSPSPHLRRSLPNMGSVSTEPPKIYPVHLLLTTNYRLPADVDRCNLERHLSDSDFEAIFHLTRSQFYHLPQWKRNDMKKRARLY